MPDLDRQLVFRVSPELLAALRADAAANDRSVAGTVRYHLRRQLGLTKPCEVRS
jgi:hypothetical protein